MSVEPIPQTVGAPLPDDEHFARNLIDGEWVFPAAPYEYEIRNPRDSTVSTVVPLSSRFDVARAVAAARAAAPAWAADADERDRLLGRLVDALGQLAPMLGVLQSRETGLEAADSQRAAAGTAVMARDLVARGADRSGAAVPGVTGHVLSWGLPLTDAVAAVMPQLAAGRTVVVKPSLRAPMSAVALGYLATAAGLPPGVVNVVQGTGEDVGLALLGTPDLALVHVRGGKRTVSLAERSTAVTGVPYAPVRGGGNVVVAGRFTDPDALAAILAEALRAHATGGPLGLPVAWVHDVVVAEVVDALRAALAGTVSAPLPTETLRRRALAGVDSLRAAGGLVRAGGRVPDDIPHRMGWLVPPTVVTGARLGEGPEEIPGPVLDIRAWRSPREFAEAFPADRYRHGTAVVTGLDDHSVETALPHGLVLRDRGPAAALDTGWIAPGWCSPSDTPVRTAS